MRTSNVQTVGVRQQNIVCPSMAGKAHKVAIYICTEITKEPLLSYTHMLHVINVYVTEPIDSRGSL